MSTVMTKSNQQETWGFKAPWGKEHLLHYQQKFYFCTAQCQDLTLAKHLVDRDRQAGFDSLMIYKNDAATLWCALPACFQDQLHQMVIKRELSPLPELGNPPLPGQRSWLDMVRYLYNLGIQEFL
ncbi:MAG: hypothetical protein SFT94_10265 [Pseudanabaenaceae cyanobacterium bins.68]|nr:hypothetical protein [Pseudanabaenaceae cyanobacterium bins.68]